MKQSVLHLAAICSLAFTLNAFATVHYVNVSNTSPAWPYTNWATAAGTILHAVYAANPGDQILVTNGVYNAGSYSSSGLNRVYIFTNLTVQSVNGPAFTTIKGYQVPGQTNGNDAIRCVYLADGATLSGFTLTNGATSYSHGGGVYCESTNCLVTNCVITGNAAYYNGAGAYYGTLINCALIGNSATPYNIGWGGGAWRSTLINCVLCGNYAGYWGGGASYSTLINCTVVSNVTAANDGSAWSCKLKNCIVYNNYGYDNKDLGTGSIFTNCCVSFPTNGLSGANNFTNPPLFLDMASGSLRLQSNSPCINAGNNTCAVGSIDLDGRPRIVGGTVDIGAYEFQGAGMGEFIGWLQQYGLPTDGSADYADSDIPNGDGMNNWQEYLADTSPLDANDFLCITNFTRDGTYNELRWSSKSTRLYRVERLDAFDSASAWEMIITNAAPGWNNVGFDNTGPQYFYRIQAVLP